MASPLHGAQQIASSTGQIGRNGREVITGQQACRGKSNGRQSRSGSGTFVRRYPDLHLQLLGSGPDDANEFSNSPNPSGSLSLQQKRVPEAEKRCFWGVERGRCVGLTT
jgi:hypothetical protein